jgi:toxin secretion/phage lysis holin
MEKIFDNFNYIVGGVIGLITTLYGGFTMGVQVLLIFAICDWVTGVFTSIVLGKSDKTINGAYSSKVGFEGICRKVLMFIFVMLAHQVDLLVGTDYLKDAICIAFILNECYSMLENAKLWGLSIPTTIIEVLENFKNKYSK